MPSNFREEGTIQDFLTKYDIPGIAGIDTRALTKILREKGTMNGMITTNNNYNIEEIIPRLKAYTTGNVVETEILKADTMYMAVDVPEGTHQIEFYYCTPYLKKGAGLSGLGILSVIGIVIFRYRNGRKKQKEME